MFLLLIKQFFQNPAPISSTPRVLSFLFSDYLFYYASSASTSQTEWFLCRI